MALAITYLDSKLTVIAGYESGFSCLWHRIVTGGGSWKAAHVDKAHSQPVLSLAVAKTHGTYLTSAADAIIASHPLRVSDRAATGEGSDKQMQTKHSGQQSLCVRSDEKIIATAGWDGRVRIYSGKTMRELAVLKWHKEGCYALAFADLDIPVAGQQQPPDESASNGHVAATSYLTVEQKRIKKTQTTHWLAAGAKDGKVSLWDIY